MAGIADGADGRIGAGGPGSTPGGANGAGVPVGAGVIPIGATEQPHDAPHSAGTFRGTLRVPFAF